MRRDMDLVRAILLAIEPHGFAPSELEIEGYSKPEIDYHVCIMIEAGLLDGEMDGAGDGDEGPVGIASRLTWDGHEFLDAARNETAWAEARKLILPIGSAVIGVWLDILKQWAMKKLGLEN